MGEATTPGAPAAEAVTPPAEAVKDGEGAPAAAGADGKPAEPAKPAAPAGLFDEAAEAPADPATPEAKAVETPLDPNDPNAYLLAEGVMGKGPKPEWFKSDKYKTIEEQAKAYPELEKRFGSFKGAPKDGKYETPPMPEGIDGEFLPDHPVFQKFNEWATKSQLSQEGYNEVMGLLAQYEASQVPDIAAIKQSLGADADKRISAVTGWAKANLDADQFAIFRQVGQTAAAAQVLHLMEAVIGKAVASGNPPRVGNDATAASPPSGLEAIRAEHGKRGPDGKLLVETDPKHRHRVDQMYRDYYNKNAA